MSVILNERRFKPHTRAGRNYEKTVITVRKPFRNYDTHENVQRYGWGTLGRDLGSRPNKVRPVRSPFFAIENQFRPKVTFWFSLRFSTFFEVAQTYF